MASGQDLVREWLFEYACRHHMPAALHEIALHHSSIWTDKLCSISPLFPMMAVVRDVVVGGDEEKYSDVLDIIAELYERTSSFVEYSIYVKLSSALKILVLFRMLQNSDIMVFSRLQAYFPRSGFHNPNADKSTEKELNQFLLLFRKLFRKLITNESARKNYMKTEFEKQYGSAFTLRLKDLVRQFLNAIETSLPQPVIDTILNSPLDSYLIQELLSSHSTSVEILLDATVGRNQLTEAHVLEVLRKLRVNNVSLQMTQSTVHDINLLMSPTGQESTSMVQTGNLSKPGSTRKSRKRNTDEIFEGESGSDSCCLVTGKRGHASNILQLQKRAKISSGDNDLVHKGRIKRLRGTVQYRTGKSLIESRDRTDSFDNINHCSKSTEPQNNNQDSGSNLCSNPIRGKDSYGLRKRKESPNCGYLCGNVNYGINNSSSSSAMLNSCHRGPAVKQCPIAFDRCNTVCNICNQTSGSRTGCELNCRHHSVSGKGDGLAEDVEPTSESNGYFNANCSFLRLESRREEVSSSVSPLREDTIPDTPLHQRGNRILYRSTVEVEEDDVYDRSYVTDSEDFESPYTMAREEIIPSSYSFDKFDLVVRDAVPTVSLPRLEQFVKPSLRPCVIKLHRNFEFNYTTVNGRNLEIFC